MKIVYNPEVLGWQIVFTEKKFINPKLWGKPVNNKIYDSWESANADMDKWGE